MKSSLPIGLLVLGAAMLAHTCGADLVTGETLTSEKLQHCVIDSPGFTGLLAGATADAHGDCKNADSIVAKIIKATAGSAEWQELWTVTACGRDLPVYISFTSIGDNTQFIVSTK